MKVHKLNLNQEVYFKIKPSGYEHWVKKHNEYLPERYHSTVETLKSTEDPEGRQKMQLWVFCSIFGETFHNGFDNLVDLEIQIPEYSLY